MASLKRLFALLVLLPALLLALPCLAQADDLYKTGMKMSATYCPNTHFDCDHLGVNASDVVAAANKCIADRMGITDPIMHDFQDSGEYENCVLPDHNFKDGGDVELSAVCCVKKGSNNSCSMSCRSFARSSK